MTARRVVVVGDVMLDVLVKATAPIARTSDTPSRIRIGCGGAGANLAASLASCGYDVVYVGACGDDAARQIFVDGLLDSGVTASLQVTGTATGVVVALVGDDGQRSMLTDRGANPLLDESFVLAQLADPFDHLHVSGYTLLDASTRGAGAAALSANLGELFRLTAAVTDAEPGGVWIERAMRAVPQLAPIRVASHRYVTDAITAVYADLTPHIERAVLWRRVRLAVELGYAVDEMLHEEDRIARDDLFADAARAIEAIFAPGHDDA